MAPKRSNPTTAKTEKGDSSSKFSPVKLTRKPANIEAQPILADDYLLVISP